LITINFFGIISNFRCNLSIYKCAAFVIIYIGNKFYVPSFSDFIDVSLFCSSVTKY